MELTSSQAADALYATACWLLDQDRHREASDVFRAMALTSPRDERGWLGLGVCHEELDQTEVSFQMYAVGQVAAAPAPRCALAMARLYRSLGDETECLEVLETAAAAAELRGDDAIQSLIEHERSTT